MAATPSGLTGSRVLPRVARGSRSAGDCAVILSPRMAACPAITSGPARKSSSVSWPTVQVSALPRGLLSSSSSDIHSCSNCGIVFYNPITMIMLKLTIFIMIMIMIMTIMIMIMIMIMTYLMTMKIVMMIEVMKVMATVTKIIQLRNRSASAIIE